ncbi:hypothetical protein IAI18_11430 [Acetobacteraceae bacterium H6797]|nr:hypothetical protein [Acetobacteraceae bacterium H6797]
MTVLVQKSPVDPGQEATSTHAVKQIATVLLPGWNGGTWLDAALQAAKTRGADRRTKIGEVTVLVRAVQPADLPHQYATVVFTTRPSLKEWD